MKNNKIIKILVILISIVNIIFVISGYAITFYQKLMNPYSTTYNITVLAVLVLILQIANIIIVILLKRFDAKRQKRLIILTLIIIVVTFFIPTKFVYSTKNTFTTNDDDRNTVKPSGFGLRIETNINLYGIIVKVPI